MTEMIACRQFTYAGKRLLPGSRFQVSLKRDVQILSVLGHALVSEGGKIFQEEPEVKPLTLKPDPEPKKESEFPSDDPSPKKRRRYYRRRDMKAED